MDLFQKKTSWYTMAVFCVLAFAFLATSFQGGSLRFFQPVVISLGKRSIRLDELTRLLAQKQAMARLAGRSSFDKEVLIRFIVEDQLIAMELKSLGITVSKKSAIGSLNKNHFLANASGVLDEKRLQTFLRESGISLQQLLEEERMRMASRYLKEALMNQMSAPASLVHLVSQGIFQERAGAYRSFSLSDIHVPAKVPLEKDLQVLYAKKEMVSPDMRHFMILRLSPILLQKGIVVSEKEIRQYHALHAAKTPLEKVRVDIVKRITVQKANQRMEQLIVKIEDALGSGKSLEKIAQEAGLPFYALTTDEKGLLIDGKKAAVLDFIDLETTKAFALKEALLDRIFQLPVGQDPDLLSFSQGENMFIKVEKEFPSKKLTYPEARPRLEVLWQTTYQKAALLGMAQKFQKNMVSTQMTVCPPVALNGQLHGISEIVKETLFSLAEGTSTIVSDDHATYVIELSKIFPTDLKKLSAQEKKDLEAVILQELRRIGWDCYLQSLRRKYPLSVNRFYIEKMTSSAEAP